VPVWHEKTLELQKAEQIQVLGIVEEQHPDRTRLFLQWKEMDWPVMVDSLNLLGVSAVPITVLIDESGVVRSIQPKDEDFKAFMESAAREGSPIVPKPAELVGLHDTVDNGDPSALMGATDSLEMWGRDPASLDEAIRLYGRVVEREPGNGAAHFRLGVALRRRSESVGRLPGDFASAIQNWRAALEIDPNQYIWRRRIQQYGPRLDKPYSFYDWIHQARREIEARGEKPLELETEPAGAEFAYPAEESAGALGPAPENPDAKGRIHRDGRGLIQVRQVVVPNTAAGRHAARVHLSFEPNQALLAHWNNEAGDMLVWVDAPDGVAAEPRLTRFAVPPEPVSQESRTVEFELTSLRAPGGRKDINAFALYYVCEDVSGTCLYRRQDFSIPVDF
jgi:hypothetical protein